jgi:hypothetical protein
MQAVLARRDSAVGKTGAPGDVVPVSCLGSHEVELERGGRLRVNRDALITSAVSGCLHASSVRNPDSSDSTTYASSRVPGL